MAAGWQVFRLHLFQRVDVALVGYSRQHRLLELRLHVARQVVVGGLPFPVGRVEENLPGSGQRGQHRRFGCRQAVRAM
jgi:hypothetical protein